MVSTVEEEKTAAAAATTTARTTKAERSNRTHLSAVEYVGSIPLMGGVRVVYNSHGTRS